jgi:hypothetical protein
MLPDAAGWSTVDSTGRTGSGAFACCSHPPNANAEAMVLATTKRRILMIDPAHM